MDGPVLPYSVLLSEYFVDETFFTEPFSLSISLFEASDALKATFFLPVSHISYPRSFDIALILMNVRSACYI